MKPINQQAGIVFVRQRQQARRTAAAVIHSFMADEPHDASGDVNEEGKVCWCDPVIEDFSDEGGGVLIIHQQKVWH